MNKQLIKKFKKYLKSKSAFYIYEQPWGEQPWGQVFGS